MAEMHKYGLSNQPPDIPQILQEAQSRWLRPTEICQILSNYKKFSIAPEPPNRPPSGSLFLFDRKILRYFRKDGHIWRKKKDGKTVKEAHEKLKVGSVDVLHCYYAHGEENENFQRRTYWLLEEGFMNIVLVHYLEIKGGKQSFSRSKEAEDSPACSNSFASQSQVASQTMDAESPYSGQISEYEDAETDNCRASSRYHPFIEMQQPVDGAMMDNRLGTPAPSTSVNNLGYQDEKQARTANISNNFVTHHGIASVFNDVGAGLRSGSKTALDSVHFGEPFPEYPTGFTEPTLYSSVTTMGSGNLDDNSRLETLMTEALYTNNLTQKETDALSAAGMTSSQVHNDSYTDGSMGYPLLKQSSLDLFKIEPNGLKKFDSFSKWMSDELAADLDIKSSSDAFWSSTETVNVADGSSMSIPINEQLDAYVVSPSLSQDQLFSIIDVSPSWAYTGSQYKVLITGTFLTNKEHVENCNWSCMFGDVEVPVEVLADGSLRCYTPIHQSGRVPFYVTCSNRVACSEVREFEFRDSETQYMEAAAARLSWWLPVRASMSSPVHARKALHLFSMKAKLQSFLGLRLLVVAALAAFLLLFSARTLFSTSSPGPAASHLRGGAGDDGTCSKLPAPVADALVHYAASNVTPQQTAAEIGVSLRVLQRRSPCNFLVFGLGLDSPMWAALNHGGRTVFLEEDASWIASVRSKHPGLESYHVVYDTRVTEADDLMSLRDHPGCTAQPDLAAAAEASCRLALRGLPAAFHEVEWDLVMVDAPTGWTPEAPGRMGAIYTAGMVARARRPGDGATDVFVHDVDRTVEDRFSKAFLCDAYLAEQVGRIRHFVIPSHREKPGTPFCPLN